MSNSIVNLLALILAVLVSISCVRAEDEKRALAYQGLPAEPESPWTAGTPVSFKAKWMKREGWFVKTELTDLSMSLVNAIPPLVGWKSRIKRVQYGEPDAEGWFKVTFVVPKTLKSGKYYVLWETKFWGNNKAYTPAFYVVQPESPFEEEDKVVVAPPPPKNATVVVVVKPNQNGTAPTA